MKFETEQLVCHSTITKKTDTKALSFMPETKELGSEKSILNSSALKQKEGIFKDDQKGEAFGYEHNEGNEDAASNLVNDIEGWVKFGDSMRMEEVTKDNETGVTQFMKSGSLSSTDESEHRDSVSYVDKSVMECDLPELVVCYKESSDHVVKDICVDEGVPIQDKFLFDNGVDETKVWDFTSPLKDKESEAFKGRQETEAEILHESAPSGEVFELAKDDSNQCHSSDFTQTSESKGIDTKNVAGEIDGFFDNISEDKDGVSKALPTLAELLLMRESMDHSFAQEINGIYQQSLQEASKELISATASLVPSDQATDNDKQADLVTSHDHAPAKSCSDEDARGKNITVDHLSSGEEHREATDVLPGPDEEGSQVDHSGSSSSTTNLIAGPVTENNDHHPCPKDLPISIGEAGSSEKATSSSSIIGSSSRISDSDRHHFMNDLQGETSFSASGPVSGLISYSGPIAYSGSLSLRSDSSTTSTRSFAFPVLQSEWNSSPVRMAKADRSRLRKHSWRQTLLCCRF